MKIHVVVHNNLAFEVYTIVRNWIEPELYLVAAHWQETGRVEVWVVFVESEISC